MSSTREREISNIGPYSGLRPSTLTTFAHFTVSLVMRLRNSSGEAVSTVPPSSEIQAFKFGSANVAMTS